MTIHQLLLPGSIALGGVVLAVVVALWHHRAEHRAEHHIAPTPAPPPTSAVPTAATEATRILPPATPARNSADDGLDWLAQAADELRTPLTVLRGQVDFLHQHITLASRQTLVTIAERLIYQVAQLEELIEAWTVTARQSGPQRTPNARPVELLALARSACAHLTRLDEPPFEVAEGPPVWVLLDPTSLEHALTVLLRSARQASPYGLVEVVVRVTGQGEQRVCVAVADRRVPVPSYPTNMWETLEQDLVRVLVEELGGWLEFEPRGGGGAVSTIWLPSQVLIPVSEQYTAVRPRPRAA